MCGKESSVRARQERPFWYAGWGAKVADAAEIRGRRQAVRSQLRTVIQTTLNERVIPASEATTEPSYLRLGLTDAAISLLAVNEGLRVLTADAGLYVYLNKLIGPLRVENFFHGKELG